MRATIGKIAPNAGAIEFVEADLNSDGGWANAATGLTMCSMSRLLSRQSTPKATTNWSVRRAMERFGCSRPRATRA